MNKVNGAFRRSCWHIGVHCCLSWHWQGPLALLPSRFWVVVLRPLELKDIQDGRCALLQLQSFASGAWWFRLMRHASTGLFMTGLAHLGHARIFPEAQLVLTKTVAWQNLALMPIPLQSTHLRMHSNAPNEGTWQLSQAHEGTEAYALIKSSDIAIAKDWRTVNFFELLIIKNLNIGSKI